MDGRKMAKLLLLMVMFDLLLFSATDAKPWWSSRRRTRRRRHCSWSTPAGVAWANNWKGYFNAECPLNYSLKRWRSQHRNCMGDRLHYLECGYGPLQYHTRHCDWTSHYQNDFDLPLNFKCTYNGFITGVASEYKNYHKDRRFSFRCCHVPGYIQHTCQSTPYLNNWDGNVDYTVPSGYYLAGVHSYNDNHYQDRRWKFEICQISKRKWPWK